MTIDRARGEPGPDVHLGMRQVRRSTLQKQVREAIEDLIVFGKLPPGERLAEVALAQQLGVSRQPVREALHTLAGFGFVDVVPGFGASVHAPTPREVREAFHVRALLEADSCELAARTIDDDGVGRLEEICAEGDQAAGSGDSRLLIHLNCQFHDTITHIAGNSVTALLLGQLQRRIAWYLESVIANRAPSSWVEHREILTALEDHDATLASSLMLRHIHRTLDRIDLRQA